MNVGATQPQQPAQNVQPTPVTNQTVVAESQEPAAPVQQVQQAEVTPVAQPAPAVAPAQPVQEVVVQQPEAAPAPVPVATSEAAPQPVVQEAQPVQQVAQPVQEPVVATVPETAPVQQVQQVEATPVAQPTPQVVEQVPVQQPVQTVTTVTETPATHTDIVAQDAINPLVNEAAPVEVAQTAPTPESTATPNGVISPSVPLTANGGAIDSSNVGFVAVSAPPKKKKNKPLIITIVLVVLVALAALGYFVIYPFVVNKFFSDPKKVYETVIRTAFNELSSNTTEFIHNKAKYELNFSFDSNMPTLQSYGGYTYGITVGMDPENEAAETKFLAINKNNQSVSYESYLKDGKKYLKYHNKSDYIYAGEANLEEADKFYGIFSFSDLLEGSKNANSEDVNYLINKVADLLIASIDESKLSKEEASINVNGETLKVINNKYQIDEATATAMVKHIVSGIADDDKAVEILAQVLETEASTLKETLKSALETEDTEDAEDEDDSEEIVYTMSIYTTMGISPSVVGYGLKTNTDDDSIHYYSTDDYFEFKVYSVTKDTETNKEVTNTFDVIGKTTNGKTKVTVSLNDNEILTMDVKDWTDTTKNFDYTVKIDDESTITGNFKLVKDSNDKRLKYSLEFSLQMGDQFIAVVLDFTEDWTCTIANIDTGSAVTLSDDQINEYHEGFLLDLYETPIGELFKTVSGDVTPSISDYYDEPIGELDYSY